MTEEQNKLAEEIERILVEYHRAVELDDASLLPEIMSQWCDLFFKPGASAILAALRREPATEAVLEGLHKLAIIPSELTADEQWSRNSPHVRLDEVERALKGKGASQGEPSSEMVAIGYAITLLETERDWEKCLQYLRAVEDRLAPDEQKG